MSEAILWPGPSQFPSHPCRTRRVCGASRFGRATCHYKSRRNDPTALKARIRGNGETRVCYGYRRLHVVLRREGWLVEQPCSRGLGRAVRLAAWQAGGLANIRLR